MKKKFILVLAMIMLSTSAFSLDKFILAYEPWIGTVIVSQDNNVKTQPVWAYLGLHMGFIWKYVQLDLGMKGLATNIELDLCFNPVNTDHFVLGVGPRVDLDSYIYPGIGGTIQMDGLIGNSKTQFELGLGIGFAYYPTLATYLEENGYLGAKPFAVEFSPRIGVKF